jgi:hypothetical protein
MSGAYRDAGAAIERAEALERELEELRAELARVRATSAGRTTKTPAHPPPDVVGLQEALVDARAERELLRSQLAEDARAATRLAQLERELRIAREERDELARRLDAAQQNARERAEDAETLATRSRELADARAERDRVAAANEELRAEIATLRATFGTDSKTSNRDAVLARALEERDELSRELRDLRDRYEAEPPASRDPKTFEARVLAIVNRLVK